jgi:hypothetical protein
MKDIAADWGVSEAYVSKMKKKGCPMTSLDEARKWRSEHSGRGHGYRSTGIKPDQEPAEEVLPAEKQTPAQNARRKSLRALQSSLKSAIEVEESAKRLVDEAIASKKDELLSLRIAAYNKARDGRYSSEKIVQEILEKNRVLIPLDEAKGIVGKILGALFSRLRAVPRKSAPKANPTDDVLAEEAIRSEIESAITEVHKDATLFI